MNRNKNAKTEGKGRKMLGYCVNSVNTYLQRQMPGVRMGIKRKKTAEYFKESNKRKGCRQKNYD